ncbi:hypothetical protein [Thalassobacillus sp. CUG 92003]|uniref:hypothetical protein n=1 Tax=Thalassobacillus sp. CUG 92003 TaxID=2736641 RepID=UPI0015E737C4|nr:hypothetical protein [Thalassobacillus sp. CUG 92003]
MKHFFQRKAVWMIPGIIMLVGLCSLIFENYQEVTEAPSENWSHEVELGKTTVNSEPYIIETQDDLISLSYFSEQGLKQNVYNQKWEKQAEDTYDIPFNKFTRIFQTKDHLLYSDYYSIYDGKTQEKLTDIDQFLPTHNNLLFTKNEALYQLHPDTNETRKVMDLPHPQSTLNVTEHAGNVYILSYVSGQSSFDMSLHKLENDQVSSLKQARIDLPQTDVINELSFDINDDTYGLFVRTTQKQSMSGSPETNNYYAIQSLESKPSLKQISFKDPSGDKMITEASHLEMTLENSHMKLLFRGFGQTKTMFKDGGQFNIYEAVMDADGLRHIKRLSNTPDASKYPNRASDNSIVWTDADGSTNKVLMSSSHPEVITEAQGLTWDKVLAIAGKTIGMLSYSFLTIFVTLVWYIWPLLFLAVMMFAKSKAIDQDRMWILHGGIAIYLTFALFLREELFKHVVLLRLPDYMNFFGSPFVFILGFACILYGVLYFTNRQNDWSISIQLCYFIGLHVSFLSIFIGPYLL